MADNDDVEESENIPALFAEITALLEDAHEIAVQGQNSKLGRPDHLCLADQRTIYSAPSIPRCRPFWQDSSNVQVWPCVDGPPLASGF